MRERYFTPNTFGFLSELAASNSRDWFLENRQRYEETVRFPALSFISDIAADLVMISPHFLAFPRKVGGSLMRAHLDVRFSRDKTPYKTNIGIQFCHEMGRDVHAPGFYLHIEGDVLKKAPRGYAKANPLVSDLKRKDFIAISPLSEQSVTSSELLPEVVEQFSRATPIMRFLCRALGLRF